jgi:hypothetical protein
MVYTSFFPANLAAIGTVSLFIISIFSGTSTAVDICSTPFNTAECFAHHTLLCCSNIGARVCCNFGGAGVTEVLAANVPVGFRSQIYSDLCRSSLTSCDSTFPSGTDCCLWSGSRTIGGANFFAITDKTSTSVEAESMAPNKVVYTTEGGYQRNATIPAGQVGVAAAAIRDGTYVKLFDSWPEYRE